VSQARRELVSLIEKVNEDHVPIEIVSKKGSAVLMSLADFEALEETNYLLRSPANAAHLTSSMADHRAGITAVRARARQFPVVDTTDLLNDIESERK
jgi:antitoxin YefM